MVDISGGRLRRNDLGLSIEYVGPVDDAERRLAEIWSSALNFDRVGVVDDFFDLGGDSLSAVAIAAAVSDAFNVDFKPSLIMAKPTVRLMARALHNSPDVKILRNVVLARSSGSRPPLFLVHGQYGITMLPPQFMSGFHEDQPVYVFQVPGFDGTDEPYDNVEEIAAEYLSAMLEIQRSGPFFIAAFCAGSWIAVEMANQMKRQGLVPDRLILIDPALHAAMDDEFLVNRGRISGGDIPILSPLAASMKLSASDCLRRTKFLFRTGHWVNGQDHASFALPAVQRFWVERQRQRLDQGMLKRVALAVPNGRGASVEALHSGKPEPDTLLQAAAIASAKLQLAFRTYRPVPVGETVDLIVSEKTARSLQHAAHPINRVLPKRRLWVFGATHSEAVAGSDSRNARLIQESLDSVISGGEGAARRGEQ